MSIKSKRIICYISIALFLAYFGAVGGYFAIQTIGAYRVWEFLIFISGPLEMLLIISIIDDVEHKTYWALALAFGTASMLTTMLAHFENILMQKGEAGFITIDYLSWGILFGLECLFAAFSISKMDEKRKGIRVLFLIMGVLCIAGLIGPILKIDALWFLAVTGFGPVAFVLTIFQLKYLKKLSK